jgi:hypothetical protein
MGEISAGYRTVRGSNVQLDEMYLELIDESIEEEVAMEFYSDATHEMRFRFSSQDCRCHLSSYLLREQSATFHGHLPPNYSLKRMIVSHHGCPARLVSAVAKI